MSTNTTSNDVILTAAEYTALFPDAYLPDDESSITFSYDSKNTTYNNASESVGFENPAYRNHYSDYPDDIKLDLTWLSENRKPREYYYDPENGFYYNYLGMILNSTGSGYLYSISCDYEIDVNCFSLYTDPQNANNQYYVDRVEKIGNDSLYKIHVQTVGDPPAFNFKKMMKISKVKIPFKNTYCFSESMKTSISKVRKIKYDINIYGDVAFINSPISSRNDTESLSESIERSGNNIYIPDKFRCSDNKYLYFEPNNVGGNIRIITMR